MRGAYTSAKTGLVESYDSGYELERYRALDASDKVEWWTKQHGIQIPYSEGRRRRRYLPDILVEYKDGRLFLEEIKGRVYDRMNFARKNLAALIWCNRNGITFRTVFKDDLKRVD